MIQKDAEELITDASAMASIEVSLDHLSQLEANLRQLVPTEIESVGRTCATHESAWSQLGANKMIQSRSVKNSIGTTGHDLRGLIVALKLEKIQQLRTTLRPTWANLGPSWSHLGAILTVWYLFGHHGMPFNTSLKQASILDIWKDLTGVYVCIYIRVCVDVCMYTCMYVCMNVCG